MRIEEDFNVKVRVFLFYVYKLELREFDDEFGLGLIVKQDNRFNFWTKFRFEFMFRVRI